MMRPTTDAFSRSPNHKALRMTRQRLGLRQPSAAFESAATAQNLSRTPANATFACSLFIVCVLAKLPVLLERELAWSWALIPALFWQDALLALLAVAAEIALKRSLRWIIYVLAALYIAINSVLMLVLSSPLTLPMLRATGSALGDSITYYLTVKNLGIIVALIGAGLALPFLLPALSRKTRFALVALATILVFCGQYLSKIANTEGLHRNAIVALARSTMPRIAPRAADRDWRTSPFGSPSAEDLSTYRGSAANRNVILIGLESTGAQYLKLWGGAQDPMPNLSTLAETALVFADAYAVYPESVKGFHSLLCSQYPAIDTGPEAYARSPIPSLATQLAKLGYTNALFHSGRFMYLGMQEIIQNRGYHLLCDAGNISGNFNSSFGVDEPATVQKMISWIDSIPRGSNFFLTYLPIAGHHPYDTPERGPFPADTDQGRYLNALWCGDKALGSFLDALKSRGIYTNTLFVIYGDHGEAFGQHPGNYGHTLRIYEENVRVPLLIAAPGLREGEGLARSLSQPMGEGRGEGTRLASLIDVAPTTLDLLGAAPPPQWQGHSLLHGQDQMALFFADYSLGLLGLRDGSWKFIYELETERSKLFELRTDPGETQNLAHQRPEHVAAYRDHLLAWAAAQKALLRRN